MIRNTCLALLLFICAIVVKATEEEYSTTCKPCNWSANDTAWSAVQTQVLDFTIGECQFLVHVKVRTCHDDGCREVKIERIERGTPPCLWLSAVDVSDLVTGKIIDDDLLALGPPGGFKGMFCFRILRPRCWRTVVTLSDCPDWDDEGGPNFSMPHEYPVGSIVPCGKNDCCVNRLWVQRDNCDSLIFHTPRAEDYADHHRLEDYDEGSSYSGVENEYDQDDAELEWNTQFVNDRCLACSETRDPPPSGPNPPPCKFGCNEDIIKTYRRKMKLFIYRLTEEQE